ncbi:hypothetical protein [Pontibacter sp. SGAir0037]|uniref:hypothetical protein n=1 Tax=Pontibacter sp. SGAir0037 TaxID=2571030 RepID=UPI0010CCFE23|nr:hypothetical protein [Pontibacter sp. SGAir0037]QCR22620.1 hypothetical protein C1N53_09895 [Pontibacter sp. SGAir0037]
MRDREMNYGNFNQRRRDHQDDDRYRDNRWIRDNCNSRDREDRFRVDSEDYSNSDQRRNSREDYYQTMYETTNYSGVPRRENYGLPYGSENDVDRIDYYSRTEGPYRQERHHFHYNMGNNPNYDNPEEGDRYRDFDSRGNHGFRHDAAYGSTDEFRDFGDDTYGRDRRSRNR